MSEYSKRFMYDYTYKEKNNYGIIVDFFSNIVNYKDFMRILGYMSEEKGNSGNALGYCFPNICDEEDIENGEYFENGVMFFINEDEVIVDYQTYYNCLKLACEIYLEKFPDDKEIVEEKLSIIRNRYNLK